MPQKRNNQEPPKVMTWGKALPVLIVAGIFDAIGFMFDWFIFFGPALGALGCTAGVNELVGTSIGGIGGKVVAAGCGALAVFVGVVGVEVIAPFGVIMAMITGLAGWLAVGLWLLITNTRIFKENALWFASSLLMTEVPFAGSVPVFTVIVWKMYRTQIRTEKAEMKQFEKEQAERQLQERRQLEAQLMQAHTAQLMQDEIY